MIKKYINLKTFGFSALALILAFLMILMGSTFALWSKQVIMSNPNLTLGVSIANLSVNKMSLTKSNSFTLRPENNGGNYDTVTFTPRKITPTETSQLNDFGSTIAVPISMIIKTEGNRVAYPKLSITSNNWSGESTYYTPKWVLTRVDSVNDCVAKNFSNYNRPAGAYTINGNGAVNSPGIVVGPNTETRIDLCLLGKNPSKSEINCQSGKNGYTAYIKACQSYSNTGTVTWNGASGQEKATSVWTTNKVTNPFGWPQWRSWVINQDNAAARPFYITGSVDFVPLMSVQSNGERITGSTIGNIANDLPHYNTIN